MRTQGHREVTQLAKVTQRESCRDRMQAWACLMTPSPSDQQRLLPVHPWGPVHLRHLRNTCQMLNERETIHLFPPGNNNNVKIPEEPLETLFLK